MAMGMSGLSEWMTEQYFSIERSTARRTFDSSSEGPVTVNTRRSER